MPAASLSRVGTFWNRWPLVARAAVIVAVVLSIWGTTCGSIASLPPDIPEGTGDLQLYRVIVTRVAAGEDYYRVTGEELHARGYATVPAFNWRLPTLAVLQAALGSEVRAGQLLFAIGLFTALLWVSWLARHGHGLLAVAALPVLLSMAPAWGGTAVNFHEVWSGQLIALSLVAKLMGVIPLSLIAGAFALGFRELALPYVMLMGGIAWGMGQRREAACWTLVATGFAVWLAWHLSRAASLTRPDALVNSWVSGGGWCYVLKTTRTNLLFSYLPAPALASVVSLIWAGLWVWPDRGTRRIAIVVTAYFLAFALVGRPDNFYWGLMVAPLVPLGLLGWVSAFHREPQA
jgi:hypothetical protein